MNRRLSISLVALFLPAVVLAAPGKIKGKVTDQQSKEVLIGVNVVVVGTTLGATTDVDGNYTILNVPAGTYSLKASYVGYQAITLSNVRVYSDLTTEANFDLPGEGVPVPTVEIVAERPLVNKNATNAVRIMTRDDIDALAVRGVNNIIALAPGVVLQDNTVFIRGGRQDEVGFYLEGVSITNPMVGGRAVTLVQDAVEEIQVQAGGYNAEFGGANSGIVQQQLKTGTASWRGGLGYVTDNAGFKGGSKFFDGEKHWLGARSYGYNELTATLSGPVGDDRLKFFGLFDYNYQRDQTPQPYPGIAVGKVSDPTSGDTVDYTYPAGPVYGNSLQQYTYTGTLTLDLKPITLRGTGTYTKGTTFNAFSAARNAGNIANLLNTGRIEQIDQGNGSGSLKLTHLVNPTTYYDVTVGYFSQTSTTFDPILGDDVFHYGDSLANARAGVIWERSASDVANGRIGRFTRPTRRSIFTFSVNAPGDVVADYIKFKRQSFTIAGGLSTQVGKQHALKIGGDFQRFTMRNYSFGNEGAMALAGLLNDEGLLDYNPDTLSAAKQDRLVKILAKRGVNNFGYDVLGAETDQEGVLAPKHPQFASGYIQDKIEYQDLVVNIGARLDYINTDSRAFVDPAHPDVSINESTNEIFVDTKAPVDSGLVEVPSFTSVSPRIGLSFPVTDRTVFHTQFGKFVQQSRLRDIYQGYYATASNISGGFFIPAPVGFDIRPTRTTQYEIGFTQQMSDFASFDITGYYKDIQDQIVYTQQKVLNSKFGDYASLKNGDYATTKGIELTVNMRRQKRLLLNGSLSFNDARGTGSFPNSNRGIVAAPLDNVTQFVPQYISPLEFNNAIRGNLNIDYHFGKNDGPPALEQFGAAALLTFNSGHPFTRGIGGADLEGDARDRQPIEALNSSTTPWVFQVDMRVDKTFPLFGRLSANVYVFVINLFDSKNVLNTFMRTGSTTDDGYLSDPNLGGKLISTYGPEYEALYRAINIDYYEQYQNAPGLTTVPQFYGPPRQVRFGIKIDY